MNNLDTTYVNIRIEKEPTDSKFYYSAIVDSNCLLGYCKSLDETYNDLRQKIVDKNYLPSEIQQPDILPNNIDKKILIEDFEDNMSFLENHLDEALNAALNGTCKAKGIARIEAALCTLKEMQKGLADFKSEYGV